MKRRQGYKGYVIEARLSELKDGGFSAPLLPRQPNRNRSKFAFRWGWNPLVANGYFGFWDMLSLFEPKG